ncbi:hypothetical protein ACU8KH_02013 [Lachancea thermotolerans]
MLSHSLPYVQGRLVALPTIHMLLPHEPRRLSANRYRTFMYNVFDVDNDTHSLCMILETNPGRDWLAI